MGNHEPDQDSNLEIEVSPLHPPPEAPSGEYAPAGPLFAPKRPKHVQLRRGIGITSALVVVLAALALSITPTREALRGAMFGPTPTATAPVRAGEDNLYIAFTPHWGAITLDDHPLAHLPVEGIDQPLHLARGVHVVRWKFAPIINFACRLTVPSASGDTCPTRVGIAPGKKGIASVVTLRLSLTNLAPAYRESLLAALRAALDTRQSSDLVRPGELYLGQYDSAAHEIIPVAATQPLRATLSFVADAENLDAQCPAVGAGPGANCTMNGDCREICTAPWQAPPDTVNGMWQAYIVAHASWRISTLDGHLIEQDWQDIGEELSVFGKNEMPVPITIGWDGLSWRVDALVGIQNPSSSLPDLVCASAWAEIQSNLLSPPTSAGWQVVNAVYIPGVPSASGCLLVLTVPGQRPLLLLHRFGVLLAANTAAQRALGRVLPMADAYEQAIARNLAQKLPGLAGAGQ